MISGRRLKDLKQSFLRSDIIDFMISHSQLQQKEHSV